MKSIDCLAPARPCWRAAAATCFAIGVFATISDVARPTGRLEARRLQEPALQPSTIEVDKEPLRLDLPPAWRKVPNGLMMMLAPENGLVQAAAAGRTQVIYGIEVGVTSTAHRDPNGVFDDVVEMFKTTNPGLRSASITRLVRFAGRLGLRGTFANASRVNGGAEFVVIAAAPIERGRALYVVGLAPEKQFATFRPTFEAILSSMESAR